MTTKIALRLDGLDLRDVSVYERLPEELAELSFEAHGAVSVAVVYADSAWPAAEAADWARSIHKLVSGVRVAGAHEELVSTSDIAVRCDVAAETVRLWAAGKRRATLRPFPVPRAVVGSGSGGKSMNVYAWADVVSWVREVIGIDPDDGIDYLDTRQHAHLNAELADLAAGPGWQSIAAANRQVTTPLASPGTSVRHSDGPVARLVQLTKVATNAAADHADARLAYR